MTLTLLITILLLLLLIITGPPTHSVGGQTIVTVAGVCRRLSSFCRLSSSVVICNTAPRASSVTSGYGDTLFILYWWNC